MSDLPKTWGKMTDAEKGALLLAKHEGKVIEAYWNKEWVKASGPHYFTFTNIYAYRIKLEPVVETVILYGRPGLQWVLDKFPYDTHRITFAIINGEPDCSSIKMEKL